ncbi:MAG TPA: hypothetical protein VK536_00185 [Candidatus Limnocylindrales bacterium]|nr:hypothetical protein [Candidatus Limnocylindrales bacterium]
MKESVLSIPFQLNGRKGKVSVVLNKNMDHRRSGYDRLVQLGLLNKEDLPQVTGFPTMLANVSYDASGYRSLFGWIQMATFEKHGTKPRVDVKLDRYPSFSGINFPFVSFGPKPSVFDSPATWNPKSRKNYKLTLDTFLTTFPILSRKEESVQWICGFKWGYHFDDDPGCPYIDGPEVTAAAVWNGYLPFLGTHAKSWRFSSAI